jgi:hypothetical protein
VVKDHVVPVINTITPAVIPAEVASPPTTEDRQTPVHLASPDAADQLAAMPPVEVLAPAVEAPSEPAMVPTTPKDTPAEADVAAEAPVEDVPPPAVDEPATEEPPVTEEPVVTDPPPVAEEPVVTDPPPVAEEPVVTDPPPVAEEPVVTDPPPVVDPPVVDPPVVDPPQAEDQAPPVVDEPETPVESVSSVDPGNQSHQGDTEPAAD